MWSFSVSATWRNTAGAKQQIQSTIPCNATPYLNQLKHIRNVQRYFLGCMITFYNLPRLHLFERGVSTGWGDWTTFFFKMKSVARFLLNFISMMWHFHFIIQVLLERLDSNSIWSQLQPHPVKQQDLILKLAKALCQNKKPTFLYFNVKHTLMNPFYLHLIRRGFKKRRKKCIGQLNLNIIDLFVDWLSLGKGSFSFVYCLT